MMADNNTPAPSAMVKPTTQFGKVHDIGRSKRYAREDHDHGAPALTAEVIAPFLPDMSVSPESGGLSVPGEDGLDAEEVFPFVPNMWRYVVLGGKPGGQTLIGGHAVTDFLALQGTSGNGTLTSPAVQCLVGNNGGAVAWTVLNNGNVGIGTTAPLSSLHLKAGTAAANTAPLQFTSGTLETTARAGVVEFVTDDWYATITTGAARKVIAWNPTQTDVTASRALNTTYTNTSTRSITVTATIRCAVTLAGGNAYVQGMSDAATPSVTAATGLVGIQAGLLGEDNTFQISFVVAAGKTYQITPSTTNGTCVLGAWFETNH